MIVCGIRGPSIISHGARGGTTPSCASVQGTVQHMAKAWMLSRTVKDRTLFLLLLQILVPDPDQAIGAIVSLRHRAQSSEHPDPTHEIGALRVPPYSSGTRAPFILGDGNSSQRSRCTHGGGGSTCLSKSTVLLHG